MSRMRSEPGPRPMSCLTCRQRQKTCDLAQPGCEICMRDGFECLGYGDSDSQECGYQEVPNVAIPPQLQPAFLAAPAQAEGPGPAHLCGTLNSTPRPPLYFLTPEDREYLDNACARYDHAPSNRGLAQLRSMAIPLPWANVNHATTHTLEDHSYLRPQNQSQLTRYGSPPTRLNATKPIKRVHSLSSENYSSTIIQTLCMSIPPSVDVSQTIREDHYLCAISEYQMQLANYWFIIPPRLTCDSIIATLKGRKIMIWTIYLGANLFQALREDPRGIMVRRCIGWINQLEQKFGDNYYNSTTLSKVGDCLLAQLELAYLKFTMIDSISGYVVLQKAVPKFLYILSANPDFYTEHSNGNLVVSFPRTFGAPAPQYGLKQFVLFDTLAALLLGVPPLVEYGYDGECDPTSHGLEWLHGAPVALVEIISQVNSWRAGSRAPLNDLQTFERRVLAWEPQRIVAEGGDSGTKNVERLAVQEGWRHVALIYVYMGMYGVSSHDSRVQASIRQIIQLGDVVANLPLDVHTMIHCVVAGLGARYEKHRTIVREKLLSFKGPRVWLFRGPDFSQILEHLWHGVGTGGSAVIWDDYVEARCAILPV
ncbi:unnamed protein product [Rhizoctonia solani]|uniref:Zn(2)-C6 fungal-type domain-containing protein n=1 Tax=Rhizoctonia solani TaxID=456999 RepID=A0A8H3DM58_9AGAM|nr:unnamed protein product [Rhizoctonia solani]